MLTFDTFNIQGFKIPNYNSIDLAEIREYLNGLDDSWFFTVKLMEGEKIENAVLKYYGDTNYTDLILLINDIDAVFGMPFAFDVLDSIIETDIENYSMKAYGTIFTKFKFNDLRKNMTAEYETANLNARYLKFPVSSRFYTIATKVQQIIDEQKEMYNLLDLELES